MLKRSFLQPFALPFAVLAAFAGVVSLAGCKSTQLAPLQVSLPTSAAPTQPPQPARLVVVDQRPQHHALRLHYNKKPAQFATLEQPVTTLIRQQLAPYFEHQAEHSLLLQLTVDQGLCVAEQSFSKHSMNCTFVFDVAARLPSGAWAKTYTAKRSREGQFSLKTEYAQTDIAFVLHSALHEFINDPTFQAWLAQHTQDKP